jgi:hypothetical protein
MPAALEKKDRRSNPIGKMNGWQAIPSAGAISRSSRS